MTKKEPSAGAVRTFVSGTVSDRILGWIGGGMIVAALALLLFGAVSGEAVAGPLPALEVVAPSDGEVVPQPLEVTFRTDAVLSRGRGGWGTDGYHLHASVDGAELMPGPSDIRRIGDGLYAWVVAGVGSGRRSVRLFWSDENHVPVPVELRTRDSIEVVIEGAEMGESAVPAHPSH